MRRRLKHLEWPERTEETCMRTQFAIVPAEECDIEEHSSAPSSNRDFIRFAALAPLCAMCGFVLSTIFGFAPF
jgi:hypothetical protein